MDNFLVVDNYQNVDMWITLGLWISRVERRFRVGFDECGKAFRETER